jgi:hypothetical protein
LEVLQLLESIQGQWRLVWLGEQRKQREEGPREGRFSGFRVGPQGASRKEERRLALKVVQFRILCWMQRGQEEAQRPVERPRRHEEKPRRGQRRRRRWWGWKRKLW